MITIIRTKNIHDITKILTMLRTYFKPYELISSNEYVYYAENYSKLYPGEDYFVYKIMLDGKFVGMMSGVNLKEFISVDYLIFDAIYREHSWEIGHEVIKELKSYNKPIIAEAESDTLCRLYRRVGFNYFPEHYQYVMLKVDLKRKISEPIIHDSNLLYLSDKPLDFIQTRNTLYRKHYMRWNSIYGPELTAEYNRILESIINK